jgi:serine/threonine protein phosphatase PrpC
MDFLKRLFSRKRAVTPDTAKTAPLDPHALGKAAAPPVRHNISVGTAQSAGLERTHNEDALLVLTGTCDGEDALPDFGLFLVADGMGGHRSGEVASSISARAVARLVTEQALLGLLAPEGQNSPPPLQDLLRQALEEANQEVVDHVPGGGTTLTAILLLGGHLTIGHVGDTRAYALTPEGMQIITRDHSLVERLRELGQLTRQEAASHPQRNVLYRAIGQGANLEVDVFTHPVPTGGHLLVCSDGLWGVISDNEIERIIRSSSSPQEACNLMIQAANAAGGPDNISAVLVQFPPG